MASTIASQKTGARQAVVATTHTGATSVVGTAVDLLSNEHVAAIASVAVADTALTKVEIIASPVSALNSGIVVIKDSGTVAADAVNDQVFLECSAAEVRQLGATLRYVGVRTTQAAADVVSVVTIADADRPGDGKTAATTIA